MFKLFSRHWSIPATIALLVDGGLSVLAVWIAFEVRFDGEPGRLFAASEISVRAYTFALVLAANLYFAGLYDFKERLSPRRMGGLLFQALTFSAISLWALYYVFPVVFTGRGVFGIALALVAVLITGWRLFLIWILARRFLSERLLIVGSDQSAVAVAREIMMREHLGYQVVGFVADDPTLQGVSLVNPQVIGTTAEVFALAQAHRVTRVVVAQRENRGRVNLDGLLRCKTSGIPVVKGSEYYEQISGKIMVEDLTVKSWLIFSRGFMVSRSVLAVKRLVDLLAASVGLLLAAPVMALVAVAIPLDSRGPILYSQERVGRRGRIFRLWKFRSMREDAEEEGEPRWAEREDPRVTRVGALLRKLRLDELPQLWNVLVGDMSLVGPRPEREPFVRELIARYPLYEQRLAVRPGITGWAQIKAPYASSLEESKEKLRYDLYYIKNLSVFLDVSIVASTLRAVLSGRGAR